MLHLNRNRRTMLGVAAAACTTLLVSGCSNSSSGSEPATASLEAGQLLTHSALTTAAALPSAASTQLITYVSEGADGEPIVVSGTVAIPSTPEPAGGYPVISWAHGTSGFADACAPSLDTVDGPVHGYFSVATDYLDTWVAQGYAVVQTDYEGLGTPGGHTYLNGTSESNTVIDIVRAARQLDDSLGTDWLVMGHSQGGQATLFAAQNGPERAPELNLKGAVAMAPGGAAIPGLIQAIAAGAQVPAVAGAFLPVIVLGAQAAVPSINPDALLTDAAQPLLTTARTGCLAQLSAAEPVPSDQLIRPGADLAPIVDYLKKQNPGAVTPQVPTMIAQGGEDTVVSKLEVDGVADELCKVVPVDYRVYPGQDHRGAITASEADTAAFVAAVMAGDEVASTCS
ncbi:lipase family protein [Rhodococcus sp. ARC_M6]|uniref:lipase family protein n=1 Tax=Rhodococcus sp. ARC_M6 TaxID=2928852 RepID=UPI0035B09D4A